MGISIACTEKAILDAEFVFPQGREGSGLPVRVRLSAIKKRAEARLFSKGAVVATALRKPFVGSADYRPAKRCLLKVTSCNACGVQEREYR